LNATHSMQPELAPEMIMETALGIREPEARCAYLDQACAGNAVLRNEVESLIAASMEDDTFMNSPAGPLWHEARREGEGDVIGRYRLLRQIGEGGFGTVFLAEQCQPVKRQVALKVIKPGMDSKEIIARFAAERQALALMDHPHIARVYDAGATEAGRPYFVMELVQGVPITRYCSEIQLAISDRLELFIDVCAAIQHAHQKGIIHRDLKPSNILVSLLDEKAVVKVIDFGIAKAIGMELTDQTLFTQQDRIIGTPQYMSPEQAERQTWAVDTRSDVYSLGAILYELLTGSTPLEGDSFRHASYAEMQRMIRELIPVKPSAKVAMASSRSLRGDLDWIVLKALEKEPSRRYESAGALAEDLQRFLHFKPVEARPPSMAYVLQRFTRRHRGPVAAAAALLLMLILGAVGTSLGMKRALDAKAELEVKNTLLDQQKLELVDTKERLAGLLESNQKMLGEISRMNTSATSLPSEFETLRKENQLLLDKVSHEVANQERYAEQISRLQTTQSQLENSLTQQRLTHAELAREKNSLQSKLTGLQRAVAMMNRNALADNTLSTHFSDRVPVDPATGEIKAPHTVVVLTADQVDETQTMGTLTLTTEQWRAVRAKDPQSPRRYPHLLSLASPDRDHGLQADYAIELSRDRMALLHRSDMSFGVEQIREEIFHHAITSLRANERGEFHLNGKLVPFPTLLKAFATPPAPAQRDDHGKLVVSENIDGKTATAPRWLGVKLPAGAQPDDAVYQARLQQLAAAADGIGLRHALLAK
jgi:serine/threonine protein kinase